MKGKFQFHGNGGELFSILIVQGLLSIITLGIYIPWAMVRYYKYMTEKTTLDGKSFAFEGTGGEVFSLYFVQELLTLITAGIYAPVANLKITEYFTKNISCGKKKFEFDANNACDFWILLFVQGILMGITLGIYTPWAIVKIRKNILERTSYDGEKFDFTAKGGELFSLLLIQGILTAITLGIYSPWAMAKIYNYIIGNISYGDNAIFTLELQGGDLFSIYFLHGIILTCITLGIYYPWFIVKFSEYFMDKMEIIENHI